MCLRQGAVREYQAKELVPGDIIHLGIGDRVPSDVRLFQATQLCIDESSFTGETEPAEKVALVPTPLFWCNIKNPEVQELDNGDCLQCSIMGWFLPY